MLSTITTGSSGVVPGFNIGYRTAVEPRHAGLATGRLLRCWNCGTPIGERSPDNTTFLVSSNKVEIGGIPLVASVWRRCRGGKANPACRAVNTLPPDWLIPLPVLN